MSRPTSKRCYDITVTNSTDIVQVVEIRLRSSVKTILVCSVHPTSASQIDIDKEGSGVYSAHRSQFSIVHRAPGQYAWTSTTEDGDIPVREDDELHVVPEVEGVEVEFKFRGDE